ncbi:MAG: universal stress protein [Candidatus Omnitrophica bacterium]|nr:universal stress protein [Candidatus Omnitrophota bacterium]MDD5592688.1 universal stress protein [Candidatus Omnitrophota bacterium]
MIKGRKLLWKKTLIATDLSEASNEVVECVAKEGKDFTKTAKLVHVISVETAGGIEDVIEKAHKPVIEEQVERLKVTGIDASYEFLYGIPFMEINRLIAEENYQLLVLGSHSKSLGKEMLLGSVSDSIIRNLTVPALLIKCKGEKHTVCPLVFSGNILFPTDFSENAKAAFATLGNVVSNYNPIVTLYHIQDKNILFPHLSHKLEEFNRIDTGRLNTLKESLLNAGAKNVITKLETGHTKQLIINEINSKDYNLVIMGTQGRGWIEEVFIGGVAHAVIRKSNTSLLLAPFRK